MHAGQCIAAPTACGPCCPARQCSCLPQRRNDTRANAAMHKTSTPTSTPTPTHISRQPVFRQYPQPRTHSPHARPTEWRRRTQLVALFNFPDFRRQHALSCTYVAGSAPCPAANCSGRGGQRPTRSSVGPCCLCRCPASLGCLCTPEQPHAPMNAPHTDGATKHHGTIDTAMQ